MLLVFCISLALCANAYVPLEIGFGVSVEDQFLKNAPISNKSSISENFEGSGVEGEELLVTDSVTTEETISTTPSETTTVRVTGKCYDQSRKCFFFKGLCQSRPYRNIMVRSCAKTCNLCDHFLNLPQSERCRDSFNSCSIWSKNGLCHSTYYTLQERKDFCRKSCGGC